MSSPRHRFGNGSWNHDFVENTGKYPLHFPAFSQVFNHESARVNTNENAAPFAQVAALPEQLAAFGSQLASSYALP
jgi:hypothetical protein